MPPDSSGPPPSPVIGLDLGTAHVGVVVAPHALPLLVLDAWTPAVDKHDPDAFARNVASMVEHYWTGPLPPEVVIEFGALYVPKDATPQAAAAMTKNHAAMSMMLDRIYQAIPGPVYRVSTIARRSWSARVVPHHQGGVSTDESNAGLAAHLDPAGAWSALSDQHRRDAAGALIGHLLGAPHRESRPGVPGRRRRPYVSPPHVLARLAAEAAQDAAADRLLAAAQARLASSPLPPPRPSPLSRPCGCGSRGPHRAECRRPTIAP